MSIITHIKLQESLEASAECQTKLYLHRTSVGPTDM